MQYRRLGTSNLKVSALCVGTMMFGKQTSFDEAARIVATFRLLVPRRRYCMVNPLKMSLVQAIREPVAPPDIRG